MPLINFNSLIIFLSIFQLNIQKLLFVNVHFRHGARSSLYLIDKQNRDLLGNLWDKRGILTSKGKRQVFLNGIKHRERYSNFLTYKNIEDEIKAYSTDSYRSICSLQCYLNGLYDNNDIKENLFKEGEETIYPPGNISAHMLKKVEQLGLSAIPKDNHLIPIIIFQKSTHSFVLHEVGRISDCQKIGEIREKNVIKNKINEMAKNFEEKYRDKLNNFFISNNISLTKDFNYSFYKLNQFCDSLYANVIEKRDLSKLNQSINFNFDELYNDCFKIISKIQSDYVAGNKDVVLMSQSPPIKKLITWMDQRIELDKKGKGDSVVIGSPRFTIWSGHDSSIANFEMFMKINFNTKWIFPGFSTTVLFELHKNEEKNIYEIKYFVNDEMLLNINYDDFKRKVLDIIWNEEKIEKFCKFNIITAGKMDIEIKKYHKYIAILILLLFLSISFNIYNLFKERRKLKEN